jgi:hypothetical protein
MTPLLALLRENSWSTDAVEWFVGKGADVFTKWPPDAAGVQPAGLPAFEMTPAQLRPEFARRYLLPKFARNDVILVWRANSPIEKPIEFKRDAEHDTPPGLLLVVTEEPEKNSIPGTGSRRFNARSNTTRAVINRRDANGKWVEVSVVPLDTVSLTDVPTLQWGDAIFLASEDGFGRDKAAPNPRH